MLIEKGSYEVHGEKFSFRQEPQVTSHILCASIKVADLEPRSLLPLCALSMASTHTALDLSRTNRRLGTGGHTSKWISRL